MSCLYKLQRLVNRRLFCNHFANQVIALLENMLITLWYRSLFVKILWSECKTNGSNEQIDSRNNQSSTARHTTRTKPQHNLTLSNKWCSGFKFRIQGVYTWAFFFIFFFYILLLSLLFPDTDDSFDCCTSHPSLLLQHPPSLLFSFMSVW